MSYEKLEHNSELALRQRIAASPLAAALAALAKKEFSVEDTGEPTVDGPNLAQGESATD